VPSAQDILSVYLLVARISQRRRKAMVRDRLLLLAGSAALELGLWDVADLCRQKILDHNPGHLVRRFASLRQAAGDADYEALVAQLRRKYPFERVEFFLSRVRPDWASERARYASDEAFAKAMLTDDRDDSGRRTGE
jgi:hypothetical protein